MYVPLSLVALPELKECLAQLQTHEVCGGVWLCTFACWPACCLPDTLPDSTNPTIPAILWL